MPDVGVAVFVVVFNVVVVLIVIFLLFLVVLIVILDPLVDVNSRASVPNGVFSYVLKRLGRLLTS